MSNLSIIDKVKFEKLLDMESGYVLDFSNASFQRFILGAIGIDVEQEKYNYGSNSKANRLRVLWGKESNSVVGELLSKLLEYWNTKKIITKSEISAAEQVLFDECDAIVKRLVSEGDTTSIEIDYSKFGNGDKINNDKANIRAGVIIGAGNEIIGSKNTMQTVHYYSPLSIEVPKKKLKIFISYRRSDSADVAGRIYDRLVQSFEKEFVFKDVDSIPIGLDFRDVLDKAVKKCDVFLAIIGNQWLESRNADGNRRIDDPGDFVKIEIESALKRKIPVVPVLVQWASMPPENKLPSEIKELAYRNGVQVRSDPDFHKDMDRLIGKLL